MKTVTRYENLDQINGQKIEADWSRSSKNISSKFHSASSYLAMFSPSLPEFFIKRWSKKNEIVYDPFSGRGTTGLKARNLDRKAILSDVNPYAIVLSRAKIMKSNFKKIENIINKFEKKFNKNKKYWINESKKKKYKELTYFYHKEVLPQLIFLREKIGKNWKSFNGNLNVFMTLALGLMHGPTRKDGSTIYFSLKMPNTISMSPNYVKNYSLKNNLIKPQINVFEKIKNRLYEKYDFILENNNFGKTFINNATKKINSNWVKDKSVSLVVTSPPYLNVVNYTNSNWLKLWLLGYNRKNLKKEIKISDNLNYQKYKIFITKFLQKLEPKLKKNAKVCLVVGDVHNNTLIENIWREISEKINYEFKEIFYDKIKKEKKTTNMLNSRSGNATIIEKVLVLRRI